MKVCKLLGKEAATPLAEYTAFRSTFSAPVIKQVLAVFSTAPGVPLTAARATWLCAYGTKTTLPATGFLGCQTLRNIDPAEIVALQHTLTNKRVAAWGVEHDWVLASDSLPG